jgi:hypothetical protein
MGYYWEEFIKEYKEEVTRVSMVKILEAYFYYIKSGTSNRCESLMGRDKTNK